MDRCELSALTDPTAPEHDDGERRALARLRYPRRAILCSPSQGTEHRLPACPEQGLDLRTSRPVLPGSTLLLLFRQGPTALGYVADIVRLADGSWRIRCRLAGAAEPRCAAQPA